MKRLLSWLLVLVMVFGLLPMSAFATEDPDIDVEVSTPADDDFELDFDEFISEPTIPEPTYVDLTTSRQPIVVPAGGYAYGLVDITNGAFYNVNAFCIASGEWTMGLFRNVVFAADDGTGTYAASVSTDGMTVMNTGFEQLTITFQNTGTEDITVMAWIEEIQVTEPEVGTFENPAVAVLGDNVSTHVEGGMEYYYNYTAEKDGVLNLEISTNAAGWFYVVNNKTTNVSGDFQWSDSDPVVNPAEIEVTEGDVLEIQVNTYNPADMWKAPAGTITMNLAYEEPAVEPIGSLAMRGMTVSLRDLIMIGYKFTATSEQEIVKVGGLLWLAEDYESETDHTINSENVIVKEAYIESGSGASAVWRVNGDGILAQNLDTKYYFVPYIQTEYGYVYGNAISPTVINYCSTALAGNDADLKSLVVDLLNYATAAREYFCLAEGLAEPATPFNSILSDDQKVVSWSDDLKASAPTYDITSGGFNPAIRGIVCNLGEAISLKVNFGSTAVVGGVYWNADDFAANSTLSLDNATGEMELSVAGSISTVKVGGLYAFNIYDYYYMRAYDSSSNMTRTYGTSVAAYLTSQINSNSSKTDDTSVALVALCQAMLVYGDNAATNPTITK